MSRGRTSQDELQVGDVLDSWRVESYVPDRLLRLTLELKSGGRGQLEFEVTPNGSGSNIRQTASFRPSGLFGRLYWYGSYPLHLVIFPGMLRGIVARIEVPARD